MTPCHYCYNSVEQVWHPVIGYGGSDRVTRVDESKQFCRKCLPRAMEITLPIGTIVDWKLKDNGEDDCE